MGRTPITENRRMREKPSVKSQKEMQVSKAETKKAHTKEIRDNKGKYSTPEKNKKDKITGRKRGRGGKWVKKKNTASRMDSTKVCGKHTINLVDTKENIHLTKRSDSYDDETDNDEVKGTITTPAMTTRKDMSTLENELESLREMVEKQGVKIATMENILDNATVYNHTYKKNCKTEASNPDNEEPDRTQRYRHPEILYSRKNTEGRYEQRDIRCYSDKKIESFGEWEASYEMDETEKDDRKQASKSEANLHHNTPDDEYEEDYVYFSHKKWESFEKWESAYDSNEEMHIIQNKG